MTQQRLSGTIVVIIIAVGVQACIIVFIFVKRQVQRFALRNRRGPHMSVGHGAPKALRREADRLLEYVSYIRHEPPLQVDHTSGGTSSETQQQLPEAFKRDFRKQIVINFQVFEAELADFGPHYIRPAGGNVRSHLLGCVHGGGPLAGADTKLVQEACDDYDAARHHYEPIDRQKCKVFIERLDRLRIIVRANKLVRPTNPHQQQYQPSPMMMHGGGIRLPDSAPRKRKQVKSSSKQLTSDFTHLGPEPEVTSRPAAIKAPTAVSSIVSVENEPLTSNPQPNAV